MPASIQISRNVTPSLAPDDQSNAICAYYKQFSYHRKCNQSRFIHQANLNNLFFSKLCISLPRTSLSVKPALISAIIHIALVSSYKNMLRIAAWPVIALMARLKPVRYFLSIGVFPCKAMRKIALRLFHSGFYGSRMRSKPTIAMMGFLSKPRPAFFCLSFLNVSPKSYFGWGFGCHMCGECSQS